MLSDLITGLGVGLTLILCGALVLAALASQDALVRRLTSPPRAHKERRQSASASAPVNPEPEWLPISHSDVLPFLSSSVVGDFQESPKTGVQTPVKRSNTVAPSTLKEAPLGASRRSGASKGSASKVGRYAPSINI